MGRLEADLTERLHEFSFCEPPLMLDSVVGFI